LHLVYLFSPLPAFIMVATVTTASGATWQEVAADRQKYRDETISAIDLPSDLPTGVLNTLPVAKTVLTTDEIKITETAVEALAAQLLASNISAVVVIRALLRRAALAQKLASHTTAENSISC
jgi:amidase